MRLISKDKFEYTENAVENFPRTEQRMSAESSGPRAEQLLSSQF